MSEQALLFFESRESGAFPEEQRLCQNSAPRISPPLERWRHADIAVFISIPAGAPEGARFRCIDHL
jgi:hypothetical protein